MPKKIVISAIGGPEVLKYIDYDLPSNLQKDHIRIKQTSIGVNFIDTYHRSGIYPLPTKLPVCPGLEAAGEIIELGTGIKDFIIGDKASEEMNELFSDLPEALENNYNLPLRCSFRPLPSKPILPNISSDKSGDADRTLVFDSEEGLATKFLKEFNVKKENLKSSSQYKIYKERLDHELKIIIEMKYSSYFLIVSDYIKWAKNNDIPVGPGRGSGAGSLVAWCLSITDLDPIKFNLILNDF